MKKILAVILVAMFLTLPVLAGWDIEPNNVDEGGSGVAYTIGEAVDKPVIGQFDTSKYTKLNPAAGDWSYAYADEDGFEALAKGHEVELYVAYDANNIYSLVITDAKSYFCNADDEDVGVWQQSCIQVSMAAADAEGGERLEYGIFRNSENGNLGAVVWAQGDEAGAGKAAFTPAAGTNYTVALKDGKLYYECVNAINQFLGKDTVAKGDVIGWNIVAAQTNADYAGHIHRQIASGCTGNGKNAQYFAKLTLGEPIAPPVVEVADDVPAAGGGEAADAEVAPVIAAATSPKTGDASVITLSVTLILAAASFVIVRKKIAVK